MDSEKDQLIHLTVLINDFRREYVAPLGCMERLEHWLILNAAMVGGVSAIVGSLQVIGICFACCLSKSILKDFNDSYY